MDTKEEHPALTPEEQAIIDFVEKYEGRKLAPHEVNFALKQARQIGEL